MFKQSRIHGALRFTKFNLIQITTLSALATISY